MNAEAQSFFNQYMVSTQAKVLESILAENDFSLKQKQQALEEYEALKDDYEYYNSEDEEDIDDEVISL